MAAAIIKRGGASMAQFRVEFVLDEASGKYFAELYSPENQAELVARTEALYASQAAAVLGLVQIFKDAVLNFPAPQAKPRVQKAKSKPKAKSKAPKRPKTKANKTKAKRKKK
jgi:hypothetical protein